MGKRRHASPRECYESLSDSDNCNSGRYFEEFSSNKAQYKKSKKSDYCELESSKYEKRKHKHKHRRRNREKSCEEEILSDQSEKESRCSSHKKKRHRDHSKYDKKIKTERKDEEPSSKWDEEASSDSENKRRRPTRPTNTETHNPREEWGKQTTQDVKPKIEDKDKEKVNFGLSGKLTEDANTYNGIVIKYSQPPEARKPKRRWRWYIFKGDDELPFLPLHRQSAYLIGRERKIADIPTDHPSCSKQHAVFQYRLVTYDRLDGTKGRTVKPYILDLESANGTFVNNRRIDARRYVELLEKDVVKFGYSSREYVLLHEASKGSEDDEVSQDAISPISLLRRAD